MPPFFEQVVNSALRFIEKRIQVATDTISVSFESVVSKLFYQQTNTIEKTISRVEKAIDKAKDPVVIDTTNLEKELSRAVKDIKSSIKPINIDDLKIALKMIYGCIENQTKSVKESFAKLENTMQSISLNVPDTFKLEEMQLRKLAGANRGISVDGGQMAARNVAITNLALTATNTQYSYTFPANTTAFTIKLRDQGTLAFYSFTTGTLPVVGGGGDASKYATIPQNYLQSQEGVDWSGKVIYLGSETASQVAEITVFTM